ncbi:MAG: hypothetical protein CVV10_05725 [Gammaproteobacteria bacterium HGW-Gammaproteobacteria-14]|nr:MAG: hypothetical protein CVV10_05725 [Gammaproteobacteria bacterium HGW-Gammaproteobacteria-14]
MVAITNSTSLTFLKEEIDSTLGEAERQLEAWVADPSRTSELSACGEAFHQLRGIFQVLELPAAALMSEEMELVVQRMLDGEHRALLGGALSQAILLLGRYLEYVQLKNHAMPEVMVNAINELRRAAEKPLIQECHFFSVDLARDRYPPAAAASASAADVGRLARRLRHMYQVGLLGVLRGQNSQVNLKLMARALGRIDRLCGPVPTGRLWWVARAVLESMVADSMVITPARKSLLAQYDRQIKRLVYEGERALQTEPPLLMLKESIYLVSLCSVSPGFIGEVKQAYELRAGLTDAELQTEIALMAGGNGSVIRSVAASLKEELNEVKQTLDLAAQGVADTNYADVADILMRIGGTLTMVNLGREAQFIKTRAEQVRGWSANTDIESEGFQQLVDELLATENAVAGLERSFTPADDMHQQAGNSRISLYQLDDARMTVVTECRSGMSVAKRGVASFLDSSWDRMHLANLPGILASVSGGLMFLDLGRAKAVMDACRSYIEQRLLGAGADSPTRENMDTLADAITSVDYYLESMEEHKPIGESVLEIAEESMEALGFPVIRPVA